MCMRVVTFSMRLWAAVILSCQMAFAGEENTWFYVWHSTLPESVVSSYRDRHGTGLIVDTYMVADEAEARMAAGGTDYDLAVLPLEIIPRLRRIGAVRPFDMSQLPETAATNSALMAKLEEAVPDAKGHALPFLWGTTGLVFDADAVKARIPDAPADSWDLLFDPSHAAALADCGISIIDSVQEVVAITLNYLGRDPNSMAEDDLDAAFERLAKIMPHVATIGGDQQDQLIARDICLALSWSSDALMSSVTDANDALCYVVPEEGSVLWADVFVMPGDVHHPEHAYDLLQHLMQPEMTQAIATYSMASMDIPSGRHDMSEAEIERLELVAPSNRRDDLFMLEPRTGAEKRVLDRRWRRLQLMN